MKGDEGLIRLLHADEIECRVSTVNEKGVSLLLYKDARVDQKILDEVFTPFGWQRSHQSIDGNLYCTVSVFNKETGEWISKQDVGTSGYAEKEKSVASDSFKRACFNLGIGRELYTAPFIWIPADRVRLERKQGRDGGAQYVCYSRFRVASIGYNEKREISELMIVDEKGLEVFCLPAKRTSAGRKGTAASKDRLGALQKELDRTGVSMEAVKERYGIQEPECMSDEVYGKVMQALAKTKLAA